MTASNSQRAVLVVEDDPGLARLVQKRLRHHGVHVECVSSGRDAIAWLREKHADLVLLDFMLPDTNAQQLLDNLTMHAGARKEKAKDDSRTASGLNGRSGHSGAGDRRAGRRKREYADRGCTTLERDLGEPRRCTVL